METANKYDFAIRKLRMQRGYLFFHIAIFIMSFLLLAYVPSFSYARR